MDFLFDILEEVLEEVIGGVFGKIFGFIKRNKLLHFILSTIFFVGVVWFCIYFFPIAKTVEEIGSVLQIGCVMWGVITTIWYLTTIFKIIRR